MSSSSRSTANRSSTWALAVRPIRWRRSASAASRGDRVGEPCLVAGGEENARLRRDDVRDPPDRRRDRRHPRRGRLDQRHRRALVRVRREHGDVRGGRDRCDVGHVAHERHALGHAELAGEALQGRAVLAVADDGQAQFGVRALEAGDGTDRTVNALVWHEAADAGEEDVVRGGARACAKLDAVRVRDPREPVEVEPEGDNPERVARRDPEPDEIVDGRLAHADQAIAHPGEPTLDRAIDRRLPGFEVALQHVPVVGVNGPADAGGDGRGLTARRPRAPAFACVRVHDVGPSAPDDADQLAKRPEVSPGLYRGPERSGSAWSRTPRPGPAPRTTPRPDPPRHGPAGSGTAPGPCGR